MTPWVDVQANLTSADVPDLRRFDGALVIVDWPGPALTEALAALDAAGVPVRLWRFTQDPSGFTGWPDDCLRRCDLAVFANEPDLEGWPAWYARAAAFWRAAGGRIAEAAWSDESKWQPTMVAGDVVTAHVYPLGRGAANLAAVRARSNGRSVYITEYGIAHQQRRCLAQMAADGVTEPTAIFAYRWQGHSADGYDVAGVQFDPPEQEGPTMTDLPGVQYVDVRSTLAANYGQQAQWPRMPDHLAVTFHHSAAENSYEADAAYQVNTEGWWHVGYHFGIEADGTIKYGLDLQYQGYHAGCMPFEDPANFPGGDGQYYNEHFVAVCLQGDLAARQPTQAQLDSAAKLLAALTAQYQMTPQKLGSLTSGCCFGHGEMPGKSTTCPGSALTWVRQQRQQPPVADATTMAALTRFSLLGVGANPQGAIFAAYKQRVAAWLSAGKVNVLDPTPCIRKETVPDPAVGDAFAAFDCGEVYQWKKADGETYLVEQKDRGAVFQRCGW